METTVLEGPYTPEDLLTLSSDHRYELVDGQLVEKAMSALASRIGTRILRRVDQHADDNRLGGTFDSECSYQIFPNRPKLVRKPDGSFISQARLPTNQIPYAGHLRIAPDLAWENVSPTDKACELDQKIEEYLSAGVRLLWIIYPSTRRIMVYRANGQVSRLTPADTLQGEDVLPGFALPVEQIFAGLYPEATS